MPTLICVISLLTVGGAIFLSKVKGRNNVAFFLLVGFILLIAFFNSGDVLIGIGKASQLTGNLLMNVGQKLPR